jgi:ubiquinone/menaquinone biosynthesis C-methylase UbiE
MPDILDQIHAREWFYTFELPDGSRTRTYHQGELDAIHDTRWEMLGNYLHGHFGGDYGGMRALDLASHQGYFSVKLAQLGFGEVHGVEARPSHVEDSNLVARAFELENLSFSQGDIHDLDTVGMGKFDLVVMLGLLYHLENPVGALRLCQALCGGLCVIETQLVPGLAGSVDFGSYKFVRPLKGTFGLIDETGETHGPEASVTGICMVPSLDGLLWILDKVGFREITVLTPPEDAYEQLAYGKRVMVAASV